MANKSYTDEQKASALAKVEELGVTKAAKELSISPATLYSWKKAAGAETAPAKKAKSTKNADAPAKKAKAAKKGSAPAEKADAEAEIKTDAAVEAENAADTKVAPQKRGRKAVLNETKAAVKKTAKKLSSKASEVKEAAAKKAFADLIK